MYGDNFTSVSTNERKRKTAPLFGRQRRIKYNKAIVMEQYQRYETIKAKYDWSGEELPFIVQDDYCVIGKDKLEYHEFSLDLFVDQFVDRCEVKAERHNEKRLKQEARRVQYAYLFGDLERRVLELGGKFKYCKKGVSITLPEPQEIGREEDFFLGYNNYDKVFLEEKVIILEKAHRERLAFISGTPAT